MNVQTRKAFVALVATQAAHSLEEFAARLYEVFGPARTLSGLVCDDRAVGFAVLNVGVVIFGLWCYVAQVRPSRPAARALVWLWSAAELVNGTGHMILGVSRGGYFPGLGTAPLLVEISLYLIRRTRARASQAARHGRGGGR